MHSQLNGHLGFGWGSRTCIGQHIMDLVNMMVIGALLVCVEVWKTRDAATGRELEIETLDYEPYTIFVRPRLWEMDARPRSAARMNRLV